MALGAPALNYVSMYGKPDVYAVGATAPTPLPLTAPGESGGAAYRYFRFQDSALQSSGFQPSFSNAYMLRVPATGLYNIQACLALESNASGPFEVFVTKNLGQSNDLEAPDDRVLAVALASPGTAAEFTLGDVALLTSNDLLSFGVFALSNTVVDFAPRCSFRMGFATGAGGGGAAASSATVSVSSQWSHAPAAPALYVLGSNVGLGLSNPAYPLDVVGDVNLTGALRVAGVALGAPALNYVSMYGKPDVYAAGATVPTPLPLTASGESGGAAYRYFRFQDSALQSSGFQPSFSNAYMLRVPATGLYNIQACLALESNASGPFEVFVTKNLGQSNDLEAPDDRVLAVALASPGTAAEFTLGDVALLTSNDLLSFGVFALSNTVVDFAPRCSFRMGFATGAGGGGAAASSATVSVSSQWSHAPAAPALYVLGSNVGLGLSNPAYPLDVVGDVNLTGALRVAGVALGAPALSYVSMYGKPDVYAAGATAPSALPFTVPGESAGGGASYRYFHFQPSAQQSAGFLPSFSNTYMLRVPATGLYNIQACLALESNASGPFEVFVTKNLGQSNDLEAPDDRVLAVALASPGTAAEFTLGDVALLTSNDLLSFGVFALSNTVVDFAPRCSFRMGFATGVAVAGPAGAGFSSNPAGDLYVAGGKKAGFGGQASPQYAVDVAGQVYASGGYAGLALSWTDSSSPTVPASALALSNVYGALSTPLAFCSNTAIAASNQAYSALPVVASPSVFTFDIPYQSVNVAPSPRLLNYSIFGGTESTVDGRTGKQLGSSGVYLLDDTCSFYNSKVTAVPIQIYMDSNNDGITGFLDTSGFGGVPGAYRTHRVCIGSNTDIEYLLMRSVIKTIGCETFFNYANRATPATFNLPPKQFFRAVFSTNDTIEILGWQGFDLYDGKLHVNV